jgi:hypothetical protein
MCVVPSLHCRASACRVSVLERRTIESRGPGLLWRCGQIKGGCSGCCMLALSHGFQLVLSTASRVR